jgi:N-acetylglucosamine kinase
VLGVIIGTGVNSALCENGQLFTSRNHIAGEWGHVTLNALHQQQYKLPLRECGCGGIGCVERYVSGEGLTWLYTYMGGRCTSAQGVVDAMRNGDSRAVKAFECFLYILAHALAQLVIYYDPDIIVLGGGVSNISELYTALPRRLPQYLLKGVQAPRIVAAEHGDSSGTRGAAILGHRGGQRKNSE